MTDHAPFLAAIIARPDLDLPRLVYADWLEGTAGPTICGDCQGRCVRWKGDIKAVGLARFENPCATCHGTGEVSNGHAERAEFIRVQCKIAEHHRPGGRMLRLSEFEALRRRERELLLTQQHWHHWHDFDELGFCKHLDNFNPDDRGERDIGLVFRRGFVEAIACSWSDFRTHADAIRKATPLRKVRLTDWPPHETRWGDGAAKLEGCQQFHGVKQLVIRDGYEPFLLSLLAAEYPGIEFELPQTWQDGGFAPPDAWINQAMGAT